MTPLAARHAQKYPEFHPVSNEAADLAPARLQDASHAPAHIEHPSPGDDEILCDPVSYLRSLHALGPDIFARFDPLPGKIVPKRNPSGLVPEALSHAGVHFIGRKTTAALELLPGSRSFIQPAIFSHEEFGEIKTKLRDHFLSQAKKIADKLGERLPASVRQNVLDRLDSVARDEYDILEAHAEWEEHLNPDKSIRRDVVINVVRTMKNTIPESLKMTFFGSIAIVIGEIAKQQPPSVVQLNQHQSETTATWPSMSNHLNIASQGGGAKGLMYSALMLFELAFGQAHVEKRHGASVGAYPTLFLSLGYSWKTIRKDFMFPLMRPSVKDAIFSGKKDQERLYPDLKFKSGLARACPTLRLLDKIIHNSFQDWLVSKGWDDDELSREIRAAALKLDVDPDTAVQHITAMKDAGLNDVRKGRQMTFGILKILHTIDSDHFSDCDFPVFNKTKKKGQHLNADTAVDAPILYAIISSTAYPLAFQSPVWDPDNGDGVCEFEDGGIADNLPLPTIIAGGKGLKSLEEQDMLQRTAVPAFMNGKELFDTMYGPPPRPVTSSGAWNAVKRRITGDPALQEHENRDIQDLHDAGPNVIPIDNGSITTFTGLPFVGTSTLKIAKDESQATERVLMRMIDKSGEVARLNIGGGLYINDAPKPRHFSGKHPDESDNGEPRLSLDDAKLDEIVKIMPVETRRAFASMPATSALAEFDADQGECGKRLEDLIALGAIDPCSTKQIAEQTARFNERNRSRTTLLNLANALHEKCTAASYDA